jgi:hypothetical protein
LSERKRRRGRPRWPTAAKAVRSDHAKAMDATKHTDNALPVHSFRTLLKDLATLTYNVARTGVNSSLSR